MAFVMRTTKPEKGNKYYIRKVNGGYSAAIKGNPADKDCDVLANCVGYAYGRFNEIGGWGCCRYLAPVNAENFIQYKGSCEVGQTPKLGACMVWQKGDTLSGSDGAGHVAIVEKVISDTEVITSESGYSCSKPFWNSIRKKGSNGNWGYGTGYKFLGFIYNPAIKDDTTDEPITTSSYTGKFKVGDIVNYKGNVHYASSETIKGVECKGGKAKVTRIYPKGKHPYHLIAEGSESNVYGWVDEKNIEAISDSSVFVPYMVKIDTPALNIRNGAGTNYAVVGCIRDRGVYTIVAESPGQGSTKGWGKLKSGAGWIALDKAIKR